jgi:hypothetical protein
MNPFSLLALFLLIISINTYAQDFKIEFAESRETITIENTQLAITLKQIAPEISPSYLKGIGVHNETRRVKHQIAGNEGINTIDIFKTEGFEIERHVWLSNDNSKVALKQVIINKSGKTVKINRLFPFSCNATSDFSLKYNPDPADWFINIQKRHKNDYPETILVKNYPLNKRKEVVSAELDPHQEISSGKKKPNSLHVSADPVLTINLNKTNVMHDVLLVGMWEWTKQLSSIELSVNYSDYYRFSDLTAICELDLVQLPANKSLSSQWTYITTGKSFEKAITSYANEVAAMYRIEQPPKNAPSLYCSWYYYGLNYTEGYFLRDINAFRYIKPRMPFDVFLIDESWQLGKWGDYEPNHRFPSGMKYAADKIKETGYIPGIWTPPYLVSQQSNLAKTRPEWLLKNHKGERHGFKMNGDTIYWVLDPTYPGVTDYLQKSFHKLKNEWGYRYFKFDFMRAVFSENEQLAFYNPYVTKLEAYRMGLEAIRRGVGDDAYISVCGGHYGGSIGLANSQRSGADVFSFWDSKELPKYNQGLQRTWMSRLWHVDPDAMMIRRNETKEFEGLGDKLSLGLFTDNEAQINSLIQYLNGALVTFTEDFSRLDSDRYALYKHVIPSVNTPSFPVDWHNTYIPGYLVSEISPDCKALGNWNTIACINWSDKEKFVKIPLDDGILKNLEGEYFMIFEFFSQQIVGIFKKNEIVDLGTLNARTAKLLKIMPAKSGQAVLAGTDLHYSMGGVEIEKWKQSETFIQGVVKTDWKFPVTLTILIPDANMKYRFYTKELTSDNRRFKIRITNIKKNNNEHKQKQNNL